MAMKLALFVSLMVAAVAVPISGAQRMGHLIEIHGTVYCPGNSNRNASGTNKGIFPGKFAQVNYFTCTHTHIYIVPQQAQHARFCIYKYISCQSVCISYTFLVYIYIYGTSAASITKFFLFSIFLQSLKYMSCVMEKRLSMAIPMPVEDFCLPSIINVIRSLKY